MTYYALRCLCGQEFGRSTSVAFLAQQWAAHLDTVDDADVGHEAQLVPLTYESGVQS